MLVTLTAPAPRFYLCNKLSSRTRILALRSQLRPCCAFGYYTFRWYLDCGWPRCLFYTLIERVNSHQRMGTDTLGTSTPPAPRARAA